MDKIELLAPAGSRDAFLAAIAAGADAIYFGTNQFNARERAENIKLEDLPELVSIAKNHNVRTYLTLNVLIYNQELKAALELVKKVTEIGVDAIIVQDIGILSLIRKNFPNVEIHASTQITTHNLEQCKFLVEMGVKQINLSRELSLEEINPLASYLKSHNIGCEIFVHGAYCISYSGQCYLSGELFNLKGNRGSCVQPCRRQYTTLNSNKYIAPFNLKDNCAFPLTKELAKAGATSLKIEGRIKSPEYVYAVTKAYREQLTRYYQEETLLLNDKKLEFSMNRGFSTGYLEANIHKNMFTYGHKDHSLVFNGSVLSFYANKGILTLNIEKDILEKNFLITILNPDQSFVCTGIIQEIISKSQYKIQITGKLSGKIKPGCLVYYSKEIISKKELSSITQELKPLQQKINVYIEGKASSRLEGTFTLENTTFCKSLSIKLSSQSLLQIATNKALTTEIIKEKLSRLGGTNFCLGKLSLSSNFLKEPLFLPLGELNNLRRQAVEYFSRKLDEKKPLLTENFQFPSKETFFPFPKNSLSNTKFIHDNPVFFFDSINSFNQFKNQYNFNSNIYSYPTSLLEIPLTLCETENIFLDFFEENPHIIPYFSSILFQNNFNMIKTFLEKSNLKLIVADNLGLLKLASDLKIDTIIGYHLNTFNSITADYFSKKFKPKAIILSPELSKEDLLTFEIPKDTTIWLPDYSHIQLMQSRQCLLRNIPNYKTGQPCIKESTDFQCIKNCRRTETLIGSQKEKILVKKRPGFYSSIFPYTTNQKVDFNKLIENLPKKIETNQIRQVFYISDF